MQAKNRYLENETIGQRGAGRGLGRRTGIGRGRRLDYRAKLVGIVGRSAVVARRSGLMLVLALGLTLVAARPAAAHADFDGSTPEAGTTVDSPVTEIVVRFTEPVVLIAAGFEILTPGGQVVTPEASSDDGTIWILTMPDAVRGGVMAVRYEVAAAEDGHGLTGGFSFTIDGPPAPPTSTSTGDAPNATTEMTPEERVIEFLDEVDDDRGPEAAADIGRRFEFIALLLAIGISALAFRVAPERPAERRLLLTVVSFLAGALVLGSALELYGLVRTIETGLVEALGESQLIAPLLRSAAGAMILPVGWEADSGPTGRGSARGRLALAGLALGILSLGLDGHTVSTGPRIIHTVSNAVHVTAAGVWFGGLVGVALLIRHRVKIGEPSEGGLLFIRFSSLATVSLLGVVVAGVTMAFFILDGWGDLTGSPWGRRLLIKIGSVSLVVAVGAYNHFRVLPLLHRQPDNPFLLERTQVTVAIEAGLLLIVTAVAASMAAASTT